MTTPSFFRPISEDDDLSMTTGDPSAPLPAVPPFGPPLVWPPPDQPTGETAIDALRRLFRPTGPSPASIGFADAARFLPQGVPLPGMADQSADAAPDSATVAALRRAIPLLGQFSPPYAAAQAPDMSAASPPTNPASSGGGASQPPPAGSSPSIADDGHRMPDFNQGTARARIDPSWEGEDVELPNGQPIPDPSSPTNNLKSPLADLRPVAAAGRETGSTFRQMLADPHSAESAGGYLAGALLAHLGHGGTFDYQRGGKQLSGLLDSKTFTQLPNFRNVSNFNVGLFLQQAGIPLDQALTIAGTYARLRSSNYRPDQPYGLDLDTRRFTELGYRTGESGVFGKGPD